MAKRVTRAGDRVKGNLGELARALEGATDVQPAKPVAKEGGTTTDRRSSRSGRKNPHSSSRREGGRKATRTPHLLDGEEITEIAIPISVRERASRLMRAKSTGVSGRGPGARFLITAYVEAVSSLVARDLDTRGFTQHNEDETVRELLNQLAAAVGAAGSRIPRSIAAELDVQGEDDDTRINLDLPFRTIATAQRLMRASRTGMNRRDSGGGSFLLRLYARAADACAAGRLDTAGLTAAEGRKAAEAIAAAIRRALEPPQGS